MDTRSTSPVLMLPNPLQEYILDTDASQTGPIAYASRAFKGPEKNWPPRDIEAFAIIWAIQYFRHYLLGKHFTVRTDHNSLKWLMNCDKGRVGRWNTLLADYEFTIIHRPGSKMQHVDYISRYTVSDVLTEELLEHLNHDHNALEINHGISRWRSTPIHDLDPRTQGTSTT
eukprot:Blabericola_migrator_1__8188@NODE_4230_length_1269_cov_24_703827_g1533_i2_p1_GENE_NODE_4230_length_1269_cov_24_703827_g1533_i2NODE_4230_length_1269_cov_24_703827_g1533_i2_p1_ORF_typecomplete_len171_score12_00RT_RNaseH/PF17917_1/5_9e25RT_RNaseH/PF17917_1/1_6e03RT_RNaseH_2/PF17919_1/2_6e13RT_RNaseH_2/PF17919_1/2_9e03_NODE_4230_length_1269_cov_24_703827_g1533_i25651077